MPEGVLNADEYRVYRRMFGDPLSWTPEDEQNPDELDAQDALLQELPDGSLQEVDYTREQDSEEALSEEDIEAALEASEASLEHLDPDLREDIRAALRGRNAESEDADDEEYILPRAAPVVADGDVLQQGEETKMRTHPYTKAARSGTSPSTLELPKAEMTEPITTMLGNIPNKHLRQAGERILGGKGLPYSTGTPKISRTMEQKPIPLTAYSAKMEPVDADVFMASLMPGMYASVMSVLIEVRRNLGSQWLEKQLLKEDGPSVLDAGAGGAGIIAWREVLKAEWQRMRDADRPDLAGKLDGEAPLGKATVLTSSNPLRLRAASMLDNTTFLPRLPDYAHIEARKPGEFGAPHGRKQFDVIVAPHSLWNIAEPWQRRQHVQNLWAMLSEDGGVLVLLEKGVPRGFEALADARQYLLDHLFDNEASPEADHADPAERNTSSKLHRHATPGAIVAPCTTHARCPMYRQAGVSKRRKDYCRFSQRYHRPAFHQNILGAKARNHEDVEFSYVAVTRGRRPDELGRVRVPASDGSSEPAERARITGRIATERAFAGYEVGDADLMLGGGPGVEAAVTAIAQKSGSEDADIDDQASESSGNNDNVLTTPLPATPAPHPLTLPRLILPPLKKPGYVLLDMCTPSGTLERWSVPRSHGRQAYRDARKSAWGDLWALGAKSRDGRRVRVGGGRVDDGRAPLEDADDAGGVEGADVEGGVYEVAEGVIREKRRKLRGRLKARTRKRAERKVARLAAEGKIRPVNEEDDE